MCRLHAVLCELVLPRFRHGDLGCPGGRGAGGPPATGQGSLRRGSSSPSYCWKICAASTDEQRCNVRHRLARMVAASKIRLTNLYGVGPIIAATVVGYVTKALEQGRVGDPEHAEFRSAERSAHLSSYGTGLSRPPRCQAAGVSAEPRPRDRYVSGLELIRERFSSGVRPMWCQRPGVTHRRTVRPGRLHQHDS